MNAKFVSTEGPGLPGADPALESAAHVPRKDVVGVVPAKGKDAQAATKLRYVEHYFLYVFQFNPCSRLKVC
jgi:hypothetical protein